VKLRFDRLWLEPESVGRGGWAMLAGAVALGAVGLLARRRAPFPWAWAVATAGTAGACAFYFAFSPGALTRGSWYHAPHVVAFALGLALGTDAVVRAMPPLRALATVGTVVLLVGAIGFSWTERARGANDDQADGVLRFGAAARAALPEDAVLATVDYPGYVALTTRRPTVALDGLTGDFDLQRDLRDLGGACTLARLGVTHLVTDAGGRLVEVPGSPGRFEQEVTAWLYDAPAGVVVVDEGDRLVREDQSGLELWRLDVSCP
jgi:hypothetical protein